MYIITVINKDHEIVEKFYTDETLKDIRKAISDSLSVYDSKQDLDDANAEENDETDEVPGEEGRYEG